MRLYCGLVNMRECHRTEYNRAYVRVSFVPTSYGDPYKTQVVNTAQHMESSTRLTKMGLFV